MISGKLPRIMAGNLLQVILHPVVLLSISDSYTRTRIQFEPQNILPSIADTALNNSAQHSMQLEEAIGNHSASKVPEKDMARRQASELKEELRVAGLLMGVQNGSEVHIYDVVEFAMENFQQAMDDFTSSKTGDDPDWLSAARDDMKLFQACFPSYECLGWYSTALHTEVDAFIHAQIPNEHPLYLVLKPSEALTSEQSPVHVYEQVTHVSKGETWREFHELPYIIQADETERLTALYVANVSVTSSPMTAHYTLLMKSLSAVQERINLLQQYLECNTSPSQKVLREIKSLCNQLPAIASTQFEHEFSKEYSDALLLTYLSTVNNSVYLLSQASDKLNSIEMSTIGTTGSKSSKHSTLFSANNFPSFRRGS